MREISPEERANVLVVLLAFAALTATIAMLALDRERRHAKAPAVAEAIVCSPLAGRK